RSRGRTGSAVVGRGHRIRPCGHRDLAVPTRSTGRVRHHHQPLALGITARTTRRRTMKLSLDPQAINDVLDGRWAEARRKGRSLALDPTTHDDPADDLETARAQTLTGVGMMAETRLPMTRQSSQMGGKNEHATIYAGFEETVTANSSLQFKAGVQFGLFGGAIFHLGDADQHEKWLLDAQAGRLLCSYAMTEIGPGSDVASVATT